MWTGTLTGYSKYDKLSVNIKINTDGSYSQTVTSLYRPEYKWDGNWQGTPENTNTYYFVKTVGAVPD